MYPSGSHGGGDGHIVSRYQKKGEPERVCARKRDYQRDRAIAIVLQQVFPTFWRFDSILFPSLS